MTMVSQVEPLHFQFEEKPVRNNRIAEMLEYVNSVKPGICIERARYLTESYKENGAATQIMLRAKGLENILNKMSIFILPGSQLVGNQASQPNFSPLFPEFAIDFLEEEIFEGKPMFPNERPADRFTIESSILPELKNVFDYWRGKTHKDKVYAFLPEEAILAQDSIGAVNIVNFLHGGDGHLSPPYKWLFNHGVGYIINECEEKISKLDLTQNDGLESYRFYKATIVSLKAMITWANRYSVLAEAEAYKEQDEVRKRELLELAEICRRVPEHPARSFHEALQFMTFIQMAIQIEDNAQGICPGRFDQELWEHYKRDIDAGIISREKALELVQNSFIVLSTIERIRSWEDTAYFRGKPIFQNMTIGGIDPETGLDASNDLTYLVLDAIAHTRTVQPSHYARWHKGAPEKYKMKVAEVIRLGTGFPAIANDDLYIPAMLNRGYEYKDAANYCIVGCAEPGVAGLRGGRTGAAWYCFAKVLEMALYNGYDTRTNTMLHPNSNGKDLSTFSSYEELYDAFVDQVKYYVKIAVLMDNITDKMWEEYMEEPLTSILGCTDTCLERGRSIKRGGAKYDFSGNETIGTANVANSLFAIKHLVFDKKLITGAQLLHALKTNFEDMTTDPTGPEVQQMCLNAPKFGNDIDEVDFIARDVLALVCEEFPKYKNTRHGRGPIGAVFQVSTTTVSSNTPFGLITGTLPDGRKRGTPLSDGQSPMRGTDTQGPTAGVRSVAKLKNILLSEGSLYNIKLLPQDLKD